MQIVLSKLFIRWVLELYRSTGLLRHLWVNTKLVLSYTCEIFNLVSGFHKLNTVINTLWQGRQLRHA